MPSTSGPGALSRKLTSVADERMIHRIRALRAKAESTTYPAEAAALRSKAASLMARHGITQADLAPAPPPSAPAPWPGWHGPVVVRMYGGGFGGYYGTGTSAGTIHVTWSQ